APAQLPYLIMGFKTPTMGTLDDPADAYALEVLASILDGGESARLTRNLLRGKQIAASAGASYNMYKPQESMFIFDGTPLPQTDIKDLEQAILDEIEAIKKHGVEEAELARVKAQVMANDVFEKDSMFYKAISIGSLETLGFGYQVMDAYLQGIESVTAEQVQAVAQKYLVESGLTVGIVKPQAAGQAALVDDNGADKE
ncbi:MAG: insulinase family protein, partial [Gammaproteobacteria bacterium]|nr:insulinase family protein [Gammaproteobacteria bacterium]